MVIKQRMAALSNAFAAWQARYLELPQREQRLLVVAAILIPTIVLYFGFWLPLQDQHQALQASLKQAQVEANEAELLAHRLQQQSSRKRPVTLQGSLLSRVDTLISQQRLKPRVAQLRPQSGMDGVQRLRVKFNPLPYRQAAAFIVAIEEQGMQVKQMKMELHNTASVKLQLLVESIT